LPFFKLEICDAFFSDHMPAVLFEAVCCQIAKPRAAARTCRVINPSTAAYFSTVFSQNCIIMPESVYNVTEAFNSWSLQHYLTTNSYEFDAWLKSV